MILILCLVLGLGGSKGHVNKQILASSITFLMLGWAISFSNKIPLINLESSKDPPVFPYILIKSKFTSFLAISATDKTASTEILAKSLFMEFTILDPKAV